MNVSTEGSNQGNDPFDHAVREVEGQVQKLESLYTEWRNVDPLRKSSVQNKLEISVAQALNDIRALQKATDTAEKYSDRFKLSQQQIVDRKNKVNSILSRTNQIQNSIQKSSRSTTVSHQSSVSSHSPFLVQQQTLTKELLIHQQHEQIDEISAAANRLHNTAISINDEIAHHQRMLSALDDQLEEQSHNMNFLTRRAAKVLRTSDWRQLTMICWLSIIAMLLFILVVIT